MKLSDDKKTLLQIDPEDVGGTGKFRVPDGVTTIGSRVVKDPCYSWLLAIDINQAERIEDEAFMYCKQLVGVKGVPKYIGVCAFAYCDMLKSIDLSSVCEMGQNAFVETALKKINIFSLKDIPPRAFYKCTQLETVNGCYKSVGLEAFYGCTKLTNFDFSEIEKIGEGAFAETGLVEIDIRNIKDIDERTFMRCRKLRKVICKPTTVRSDAFRECESLENFDFSQVDFIGDQAFGNTALSSIYIPLVNKISARAFRNCKNLTEVIGSPERADTSAFAGCTNLKDIHVLTMFKELGPGAFDDTPLMPPDNVKESRRLVHIQHKGSDVWLARLSPENTSYIIGSIIDETKNAYTDKHGTPFIIDKNLDKQVFSTDTERFMELWKAS